MKTINELNSELISVKNDPSLSEEEKNKITAVLTAGIDFQKSDEIINNRKAEIQKSKMALIDSIMSRLPNFSNEEREKILYLINSEFAKTCDYYEVRSVASEIEDMTPDFNGMFEKILSKIKELYASSYRKFVKLEEDLDGLVDPELFVFDKPDPSDPLNKDAKIYKDRSEFDAMYMKEIKKYDYDDTFTAVEKGIIREIVTETIKYGLSHETLYNDLPDLTEYINQYLNNQKSNSQQY